jgi:hypothetical protein
MGLNLGGSNLVGCWRIHGVYFPTSSE